MKKFLGLILGINIIVLSTISCTFAYTQEQAEAYKWAYQYGITTQPTIESANLDGNITRQAFAKMIVNYIENTVGIQQFNANSCIFLDENKFSNGLKIYAKKSCAFKIMGSNGANFNPTNTVNRAQLGTVLSRVLWGNEYNASGKQYYVYHLNALKFNGIMNKIDNPQANVKRGDVFIMLKRIYEKFGSNININGKQTSAYGNIGNNTDNGTNNKTNNKTNSNTNNNVNSNSNTVNNNNNVDNKSSNEKNNNEKYLTQDEIQKIIEKEEGLKAGSLDSRGYECYGEKCNYEFSYTVDGKKYIYYRENTASAKTKKVQDLGIDNAEEVALKDAKVSRNDAQIKDSFSSNGYNVTIITKDNVFVYKMSLDGNIKEKKTLITEKKALETILKETKLEQAQNEIEKENKEICRLYLDERYECSFTYGGKVYLSYINAEDGTFIPIKKTATGVEYGKSVTGKKNVIISDEFKYIDYDGAKEILTAKYDINEGGFSMTRKMGEGKNAIYIYTVENGEYYIDATSGKKMYSKDEILANIAKDSGVSVNIIKNAKNDDEEGTESVIGNSYVDVNTEEVCSIYAFNSKGTTYTYKVRNIDGKILNSKQDKDIGKDKVLESAKKAIQKKYSPKLKDDYEIFNWSRAYMRFASDSSSDDILKIPSEPEYVVNFLDENYIYRVISKYDGSILSEDRISMEDIESNFFAYVFYFMGYDLDDLEELNSQEFGGSFSIS